MLSYLKDTEIVGKSVGLTNATWAVDNRGKIMSLLSTLVKKQTS